MKLDLTTIITLLEGNPALASKINGATILAVLKVVNDFNTVSKTGTLTPADEFRLADELLAVLEAANFTIADVRAMVASLKPLFVTGA